MAIEELKLRDFEKEFSYLFSRSSGPGGQNVNKVNSRVELRFNVFLSQILSREEKDFILEKLSTKISKEGDLILVSQSERSQLKNKEVVIEKFYKLIDKALIRPKKRKPTVPSGVSREKRLEQKRINSEKKNLRKKSDL